MKDTGARVKFGPGHAERNHIGCVKVYHMFGRAGHDAKGESNGLVSPLCAEPNPRALDLAAHQIWTIRWEAVTCKKCLRQKPT